MILIGLSAAPAFADITVSATVDAQQARVGESITLVLTVEGAQNVPAPQIRVGGLDTRYIGPSTQVSIVNGRMSSSIQHRYSLLALQPGRFEVGPITIDYDGKNYATQPIGIEFVAANAPAQAPGAAAVPGGAQGKSVFAKLSTPRSEVYLHESLPIDLDLYVGTKAGDLQYPSLPTDGISIEPFGQPTQRQQVIDGQTYQVVHFHSDAVPLRSGALTLGPASLRLAVYEQRNNRRNDPFFDNFFQQGRQVEIHSEPLAINVLPLPDAGKPADFSGAVGTFTMQVSAAPLELTAGDPITVRLDVSGEGNLADGTAPLLTKPDGFRVYDPRATKSDANGRSFEQVLIPNDAGVTVLPPYRFSYFDPKTARYGVIESQPIALQVRAPQQAPRTDIVSADGGTHRVAPEEKLGRDIVFIKDEPGTLAPRSSRTSTFWLLLLWLPIPPLLFVTTVWYDNHRRRLSGDERYARFTRAGKQARHGLAAAHQAMSQGQRNEFYEAVAKTMREYLSAKLGIPVGAVDADAVSRSGVASDVVEQLRGFFATCEHARFAPSADTQDLHSTMALAEQILTRVERERRSSRRHVAAALLVLALGTSGFVATSKAADSAPASPQTTFFHANSLYNDGKYADAAAAYEQLVQLGLESSPLYFNLGNAYFKAGDRGKAILYYERALRIRPNDPDVDANLTYAQSLTGAEPCTPPLWHKLVFPMARRASTSTLLTVAGVAYGLMFLLLIAQRLLEQAPRWLGYTAIASGVAAFVIGASGVQQAYTDHTQAHAVVTADGDTPARFEPADNGTLHFSLKQGSVVQVLDQREGWLQIARCDGRRGWVPRGATSEL